MNDKEMGVVALLFVFFVVISYFLGWVNTAEKYEYEAIYHGFAVKTNGVFIWRK